MYTTRSQQPDAQAGDWRRAAALLGSLSRSVRDEPGRRKGNAGASSVTLTPLVPGAGFFSPGDPNATADRVGLPG